MTKRAEEKTPEQETPEKILKAFGRSAFVADKLLNDPDSADHVQAVIKAYNPKTPFFLVQTYPPSPREIEFERAEATALREEEDKARNKEFYKEQKEERAQRDAEAKALAEVQAKADRDGTAWREMRFVFTPEDEAIEKDAQAALATGETLGRELTRAEAAHKKALDAFDLEPSEKAQDKKEATGKALEVARATLTSHERRTDRVISAAKVIAEKRELEKLRAERDLPGNEALGKELLAALKTVIWLAPTYATLNQAAIAKNNGNLARLNELAKKYLPDPLCARHYAEQYGGLQNLEDLFSPYVRPQDTTSAMVVVGWSPFGSSRVRLGIDCP